MENQEIAKQLRCPSGNDSFDFATRMSEANESINQRAIRELSVSESDSILELGPGNGRFVEDILGTGIRSTYVGLDWSASMVKQATKNNRKYVDSGRASFVHGNCAKMSFGEEQFSKVLAVHVIYFWDDVASNLVEILRVMKPGGALLIGYGCSSFMHELPFTQHGFQLYDVEAATHELQQAGFESIEALTWTETGTSNTGEVVNKRLHLLKSNKSDLKNV